MTAPSACAFVREARRGRSDTADGPISWLYELRDPVGERDTERFFAESADTWTTEPDSDGWFYLRVGYPAHQCDLGCDEPPFFDVHAIRWLPADQVPAGDRYVAGRALNADGTVMERPTPKVRAR
ncbi:hypothetical protein ACT17_22785 [Mycolicibacterium conceptionense]|uniref:Uncharacterized protein n=1 Tax=Mycolicibacterium conceptionense TaxID=451644 RepID=A0A0J8U326_9MYCO|nr:hypothetical protein [Mycolicibacterium conceptionense]KMV15926.1 hypothetical protein ACT17_22785 [Mycolicibacterium conceptionense]